MSRHRIGRLAALSLTHAATDFYQGSVVALIPFLVHGAGFTYTQATGLVLAATVGSSVAQPFFGILADRHETFWLVPASLVASATGIGLLAVVDSYAWTAAAVAVSGLGVAAYHPVAARLARRVGGGGAQVMSWFIVGGNVGLAVAPTVIAALLISFGLDALWALAAPGLLAALATTLARRWLLGTSAGTARDVPAGATDDWRSFGWLAGVAVLRSTVFFGISSLVGVLVIDELDAGQGVAAAALTLFLAVGVVATVLGGVIADRRARLASVRLGFALVVPGLLLVVTAPSVPLVLGGVAVAGVGTFLPFSVQTTLGHEYLPHRVGTASGVTIGLSVSVGGAFAPVLGALSDAHGPRAALTWLVVVPLVALIASTRLPESRSAGQVLDPPGASVSSV